MKEEGRAGGPRKAGGKRIKERGEAAAVGVAAVPAGGEQWAMSHVQTNAEMKIKDQHQSNEEPFAFRLNPERGVKVSARLEGSTAVAAAATATAAIAAEVVAAAAASAAPARAEEAREKEMTRKWIPYANLIK